jgi:hypothetical protein
MGSATVSHARGVNSGSEMPHNILFLLNKLQGYARRPFLSTVFTSGSLGSLKRHQQRSGADFEVRGPAILEGLHGHDPNNT